MIDVGALLTTAIYGIRHHTLERQKYINIKMFTASNLCAFVS